MKRKAQYFTGLAVVAMAAPATADIIYGSLQQTISTDYTGVTVTVGSGTLNPFFGGAGVANNNALQPFRMTDTGGLATIKNFATGIVIDSGSGFLATGAGGSTDHVGTTFTDGTEGYVGFKLNDANYGWARVVFTNNTSTPVTPTVKDWAYDNTGAAIKTGWINTDIVSPTAQTVTLNPGTGEAFTLGSQLADASGSITNSVLKTGAGTTTLTGSNTYTGATTINNGTLNITGSIHANSAVTVAAGTLANTPVAKLGGTGTIGGTVSLTVESASGFMNGGVLAPTAAASGTALDVTGTTTFSAGSIFEWNMSATTPAADPGVVPNSGSYGQLAGTGVISGSNAVFKIVLGAGNAFTDAFWNSNKTWTNVFTGNGATTNLASIFSSISGAGLTWADNKAAFGNITPGGDGGYFTFSGTNTLSWTAVPEPTSALAGLLLGAGLLRRRR